MRSVRLKAGDGHLAKTLFRLMAEVFEEECQALSDGYVDRLLARPEFWALAAFEGDEIVGGLTAHSISMTTSESSELFIYDIAVRNDHQRKGVGRALVDTLRRYAAKMDITVAFVPADNADLHALDFYRALGGVPASVTIFTFEERPPE